MKILIKESQLELITKNIIEEEILTEFNKEYFRGKNILYHTSNNTNIIPLLSSGVLKPNLNRGAYLPSINKRYNCISFSRDKNFTMNSTASHTLMFDGDLLKRDYKIIPYNDFQTVKKSDPDWHNNYRKEYEEALLTNNPLPIEKYLIGIRANNFIEDSRDEVNKERFNYIYNYCKEKDIPYFSAFGRRNMLNDNL